MTPSSGTCTPKIRLHSVDLPAPFSPRMQCTSPGMMSSEASDNAINEPNRLVTPCSASSASAMVRVRLVTAVYRGGTDGPPSAFEYRDLTRENVLLDRVELRLLLRSAAADYNVGGFGSHLQAEFLVPGLPIFRHGLVDGVLHLESDTGDRIGDV